MWKVRRFFVLLVGVGAVFFLCSCRSGFDRRISDQTIGRWVFPFVTDTSVEAPPKLAMLAFLASLRASSVSSLSWDIESGFIVWSDTGEHFSPIDSGAPSPTEGIDRIGIHVSRGWHGQVFGTARVTALGDDAWLQVNVRGRSSDGETNFYSNGMYEKRLLSMARWQAKSYNTGVAPLPDFPAVSFGPIPSSTPAGNLETVSASRLRAAVDPQQVGWPEQDVWSACFNILMQKGSILHVNPKEKMLVLLGQQVVEGGNTEPSERDNPLNPPWTRQDVVILAHVRSAGDDRSLLYLAYLNDQGELSHIPQKRLDQGKDVLEELAGTHPVDIVAAGICRGFETLLARQLTYREWEDKLTRRMVETAIEN